MTQTAVTYPLLRESANAITAEPGKHSTIAPHVFHVTSKTTGETVQTVQFQDGPLAEDHIPGVHNEDLLLMVRERLLAFQKSDFSCRENAIAITKIEEALNVLCYRTEERRSRDVEGKNVA
jgi:hypothetical protein